MQDVGADSSGHLVDSKSHHTVIDPQNTTCVPEVYCYASLVLPCDNSSISLPGTHDENAIKAEAEAIDKTEREESVTESGPINLEAGDEITELDPPPSPTSSITQKLSVIGMTAILGLAAYNFGKQAIRYHSLKTAEDFMEQQRESAQSQMNGFVDAYNEQLFDAYGLVELLREEISSLQKQEISDALSPLELPSPIEVTTQRVGDNDQ